MKRILIALLVGLLAGPGILSGALAQDPPAQPPPPAPGQEEVPPGELQRAMRDYFANRLRAELALSDEQAEQILPRIEQLERERAASRQTRIDTVRQLRWGLEHGAGDDELQQLLDHLEQTEHDLQARQREAFSEIDQVLSVRQRVQLRFFVERFTRTMRERINQLRGGARPGREPGRRPPRRAPDAR
jgi:hypothetical protein